MKGEVRLEQMFEDDTVFEPGRSVILSASNGSERETKIEFFQHQHGRCVAKFRGIDSISEAENYVGNEVRIPVDSLPAVKDGWFYTFQLKGCRVFENGEYIGTITDVLDFGSAQILKVDLGNAETLIPFVESYLKKIDLDGQRIDVKLPEGLRDLNK